MLITLQRAAAGPGPGGQEIATLIGVLGFYGLIFLVALAVSIFFLLTLSNCFKEISPKNRQMEPGQVWLNLIPLFNYVWLIITILRLSDSLKDEYEDRDLPHDGDYGKTLGIIYYVSQFVCPCATIILLILYWVKVAGFTKELRESKQPRTKRARPQPADDADDDDGAPTNS